MQEDFESFHLDRGRDLSGDRLTGFVPDSTSYLNQLYPDSIASNIRQDDIRLHGSQIPVETAYRFLMNGWEEGRSTDEIRSDLEDSEIFGIIREGFLRLDDYMVRRGSVVEVDGRKVPITNDTDDAGYHFRSKFRDETGFETLPSDQELRQFAKQETEGEEFYHGIHEQMEDVEPITDHVDIDKAEKYVEYVQDLYEELWGSAPRGRGIGGSGLAENRLELLRRENPMRFHALNIARKVSPETVDGFLYDQVRSEVEEGTHIVSRTTQQWTPRPSFFARYGRGSGNQPPGVILLDKDVDTILSSGLVGKGNPDELEVMGDSIRHFDPDKVMRPEDFDGLKFARWSLGNLKNTSLEPEFR